MSTSTGFPKLLAVCLISFAAVATVCAQPFFDYDRKADLGVFRPTEGNWYARSSESGSTAANNWGLWNDRLVPGDYDGDGLTDIAVWRPNSGIWYVLRSRDAQMQTVNWGTQVFVPVGWISDEPVPGDYDGDGNDDFAVWRASTGTWYVLLSKQGFNPEYAMTSKWGKLGDIPVPADYDGDHLTDEAIFRSTENRWYIRQSSDNAWRTTVLGQSGFDRLVPGDYTGDGRADYAIFRRGLWIIEDVVTGARTSYQFGLASDEPVPADYNGDGKTDPAVYRNGVWFILDVATGNFETINYGLAGDVPLPALRVRPSIVPIP